MFLSITNPLELSSNSNSTSLQQQNQEWFPTTNTPVIVHRGLALFCGGVQCGHQVIELNPSWPDHKDHKNPIILLLSSLLPVCASVWGGAAVITVMRADTGH